MFMRENGRPLSARSGRYLLSSRTINLIEKEASRYSN